MKKILLTMLLIGTMKCSSSGEIFGYDAGQETYFGSKQTQESLILLNVIKFLILPISAPTNESLITSRSSSEGRSIVLPNENENGMAASSSQQMDETAAASAKKVLNELDEKFQAAEEQAAKLLDAKIKLEKELEGKTEGAGAEEIKKKIEELTPIWKEAVASKKRLSEERTKAHENFIAITKKKAEEKQAKEKKAEELELAALRSVPGTILSSSVSQWATEEDGLQDRGIKFNWDQEIPIGSVLAYYTIKKAGNFIRFVAYKGTEYKKIKGVKGTVYFVFDPKDCIIGQKWIHPLFRGLGQILLNHEKLKDPINISRHWAIHAMDPKVDREPLPSERRFLEMGQLVSETPEYDAVMFGDDGELNTNRKTGENGYNPNRALPNLIFRIIANLT